MTEVQAILVSSAVALLVVCLLIRSNQSINRKSNTIAYLMERSKDIKMDDGMALFGRIDKAHDNDIRKYATLDSEKHPEVKDLLYVLNHYEYVAIGIESKIFDERMLKNSSKTSFVKIYEISLPFIDEAKKKHPQVTMIENYCRVAKRWVDKNN